MCHYYVGMTFHTFLQVTVKIITLDDYLTPKIMYCKTLYHKKLNKNKYKTILSNKKVIKKKQISNKQLKNNVY